MALIEVPGYEIQRFRKQTLRELYARAGQNLTAEDRRTLDVAMAIGGLYFDEMDAEQRQRVAAAVLRAADVYRAELLKGPDIDESDQSRAEALGELAMILTELATGE